MAHIHKKIKKGRPYYYIREIARIGGKPTVVSQVYLGSVERILEMAQGAHAALQKLQVQEFGALWLADRIDQEVGLAAIIDAVVPAGKNETGPSVGEYFLYAVFNRMIDARSKRALPDWYKGTAIQQIRPVDIDALSSERFWKKWERVDQDRIGEIASRLFRKVASLESSASGCFLLDTTNYYTFMAGNTESELAQRGKSKEGRDWLRQIGLALLVDRDTRLPLFYREYEGNCHDSKLFSLVMEDVLGAMRRCGRDEVTVIVDKGMNSEENMGSIDAMEGAHFVTTYSTYFAEELVHVDKAQFSFVDTPKNRRLRQAGRETDLLMAWRTTGQYWGRERTVVVTYNPLTASKQRYAFEKKLLKLQTALYEMRSKVRGHAPQWRDRTTVMERYEAICDELHLPGNLYDLDFDRTGGRMNLSFRKNHYRIGRHIDRFGKNIIITDRDDWSLDEIVMASLDRYMVEQTFRQTKDDDLISLAPVRHWTDSKIRCHVLSCIVALCYLRLIEIRLEQASVPMTAAAAMDHMRRLHSCLCWHAGRRKPVRIIEEPTEAQALILKAFGYEAAGGVLQKI